MGRQNGYYWVRDKYKWMVAKWCKEVSEWSVCGNPQSFFDSDFIEIGNKVEPPK